jgi:hypothetical protein
MKCDIITAKETTANRLVKSAQVSHHRANKSER